MVGKYGRYIHSVHQKRKSLSPEPDKRIQTETRSDRVMWGIAFLGRKSTILSIIASIDYRFYCQSRVR
jgi:hypothetical protein